MTIEEEYLKIIIEQNEIIEENKLVNSLIATASLFASTLFPLPKVSDSTTDFSRDVEMVYTKRKDTVDENKFKQTDEEVFISKFIYAQIKDYIETSNINEISKDVEYILKTLATRHLVYKERKYTL